MTVLLFVITLLGVALAVVVARADPKRWDNRLFALIALCDALTSGARGVQLLLGHELGDLACMRTAVIGNILIAHLSIEFAYSFPFNRRLPPRQRAVALSAVVVALALILHPATWPWFGPNATYLFFLPFFVWTLALLYGNYRELQKVRDFAGIPQILFAVAFRWVISMFTYLVAKRFGAAVFSAAIQFEAISAVFLGYVLFGGAILRYHLFSVKGAVAEVMLYSTFAFSTVALVWLGIDLTLTHMAPSAQRPLLVAAALLPIALFTLGSWLRPRVTEAILSDPGRERAKNALGRVVRAGERGLDVDTVLAMTVEAIAEITGSSRVRFVRGPAPWPGPDPSFDCLEARAVDPLLSTPAMFLHRPRAYGASAAMLAELDALPEELLVLTRRAGELFGVFAIEGGTYNRDAIMTCVTLSEHLSLRIETQRLFVRMSSLQAELEESRRLASLGSFAAAIAHDIRTPLTSIQMNIQILRSRSQVSADDMEYFDITLEEVDRLNANISEILDFAKPIRLDPTRARLSAIAGEAVSRMRPIFAAREVSVETDLDEALPAALVDAPRIRQVLINLLDNAAQASKKGASIVLSTRAEGGGLSLSVSDSGRGIRAEDLPRIFEPFFTTRADGTGLGLAIAHKLVRAHGGEIRVSSALGEGSTFTLVLPAEAPGNESLPAV